jgi:mono/diheme cytochrome c family protein
MPLNWMSGRHATIQILAMAGFLSFSSAAQAQSPSAQRGVVLARTYCAGCHSIDKLSPSTLANALPFRELHKNYPVESLAESLAEGLVTGHPNMPEFRFDPDQIGDFISYLKTLE